MNPFFGFSLTMAGSLVLFISTLGASIGLSKSFDLTIMHTNDVHARFQEVNKYGSMCSELESQEGRCFGGVARRMTKIKEIRQKYQNTLLLDGGDQFQGSQWFYFYRGMAASTFMDVLGYDAMALGNHEFDLGIDVLARFLNNVTFPVLSCNVDTSRERDLDGLIHKSVIITGDRVGGERIGIVGYTFHGTPDLTTTGNVIFHDEITEVQREVNKLIRQGVNKIIGLGHAGYDVDLKIANQVRGIDIIIGGHTDTFLYTGTPPTEDQVIGPYPTVVHPEGAPDETVLVVQAFTWGKYLGLLRVTFDDDGRIRPGAFSGNPITLNAAVPKDPELLAQVEEMAEPIEDSIGLHIGKTYVLLDGTRSSCRTGECNLGNVVTDAMLEDQVTFREEEPESWSDVSIAITNAGAIRTAIAQGDVTMGNVYSVLPFLNTNDVIELKGKYLLEALENSVSNYDPIAQPGRFLQMSGIIVWYDISRPSMSRVVSAEVRCSECVVPDYEPLDLDKVYRIIIPTYIADGGDGYTMISENKISHISGNLDAAALINYIHKHSPVLKGIERRINFVEEPSTAYRNIPNTLLTIPLLFICVLLFHVTNTS